MRLDIETVQIKEIQEGPETLARDGVLYLNLKELQEEILTDSRFASVDINLVYPGDAVRVVNLMDVVQPRCKIDRLDADFPGFIGKMQTAGKGRTRSLAGVAVLVSDPRTTRKYSALLDMYGLGGELSLYGRMRHISISPQIAAGVEERDFENSVKLAGFKTAVFLARAAAGHPPASVETYELDIPNLERNSGLPRVAYHYQMYTPQHDHHGLPDLCFYGGDVRNLMPTIIHPNEVLDGGVVGHHTIRGLDTYLIQNHGTIKELYRHHGKDLIFAGVVCDVANMEPVARNRKAMMASSLAKNVLGADGIVLTKIHGGMPHVDLAAVAIECEKLGVKTAIFTHPLINDGTLADSLLFNNERLDLIITGGATMERIKLPKPERILGGTADTKIFCPDPSVQQHAGDLEIDVEQFLIAGVHDYTGGAKVITKDY